MKAIIENVENGYVVTLTICPKGSMPLQKSWIVGTLKGVADTIEKLIIDALQNEKSSDPR